MRVYIKSRVGDENSIDVEYSSQRLVVCSLPIANTLLGKQDKWDALPLTMYISITRIVCSDHPDAAYLHTILKDSLYDTLSVKKA